MALRTVPTSDDPFYLQRTSLEGVDYTFEFFWSTRESCWYLDLSTFDDVEIVSGLKLICNTPLLYRLASATRPPGELIVISKTDDDSPPGLEDLIEDTGRCSLLYVETVP